MEKLRMPFDGSYKLTQGFGENLNSYYKTDGLLGHGGIDWACPLGTPILSICNGTVVYVSSDIRRGEGVSVISDDIFQSEGQDCKLSIIYWHLKDKSIVVKVGDKVSKGQLLGLSNNTGQSTGNHLHLGFFPLAIDGNRELFLNNGYKGAVDPLPFLNLTTAPIIVNFSHSWQIPIQRVKDFQIRHGLIGDGIVGKLTQAKIEELI